MEGTLELGNVCVLKTESIDHNAKVKLIKCRRQVKDRCKWQLGDQALELLLCIGKPPPS